MGFAASYAGLWALVVFQSLISLALLRRLAELRQIAEEQGSRPGPLPIGTLAPEFNGLEMRLNRPVDISILGNQGGVILFLSPKCSICKGLVSSMWRAHFTSALPPTVAMCSGSENACKGFAKLLGSDVYLLLDPQNTAMTRYRIDSFPAAVIVDSEHKIRQYGHPKDVGELRQLWAKAAVESPLEELEPDKNAVTANMSG